MWYPLNSQNMFLIRSQLWAKVCNISHYTDVHREDFVQILPQEYSATKTNEV